MKIEVTTKTSKLDQLKLKALKELQRFIKRILALGKQDPAQDADQAQETQNTPPTSEAIAGSEGEVKEDIVINSFGSPNCSKAKLDPETQIKDLKVSNDGLSYKWSKGSLKNWGIENDHDARALAIMGHSSDGKQYKCAKADWISTDRLTRSFENIDEGYNGFNGKEFRKAAYKCFFIMSVDGKKRTNVLTTFRPLS